MRPQEFDDCFSEYVDDHLNDAETEVNLAKNDNYDHLSQLRVNTNMHEVGSKWKL